MCINIFTSNKNKMKIILIIFLMLIPKMEGALGKIEDCLYIGIQHIIKMRLKFTIIFRAYYHPLAAISFN
jgi:hypothetical protein